MLENSKLFMVPSALRGLVFLACAGSGMLLALAPDRTTRARTITTRIELRGDVDLNVTAPTVALGDVASIDSADANVVERLAHLPIAEAPRIDHPVVVDQIALARWVRAHADLEGLRLEWGGALAITVRAVLQVVGG